MSLIPPEVIAEIRARADLAAIIGEHVALTKSGVSLKGLCPFHNERTPSFYVHPAKQFFHCFGCGEKGDVFTFLARMTGGSFSEVARDLAGRVDIAIPERERTPRERHEETLRSQILEVNAIAAAFFEETLARPAGAPGRDYLGQRGLDERVRGLFRLGFALESWDALTRHLADRKLSASLAEQTGLVRRRRERGRDVPPALPPDALVGPSTHFDFFRGRLLFPVLTPAGDVVAFSGRLVVTPPAGTDPPPKYINSPETPVYKKGRMLYGLHAARAEIQKKGRALLVEGNVDVVMLHQVGLGETVAPLGTALTAEQAETLRRLTRKVVLATDGDAAGKKAALKDIPLLAQADLDVLLLSLPDGEDPDSLARKIGGEALGARVDGARDAVAHLLGEVVGRAGGAEAPAGARRAALLELAPLFAALGPGDRQSIYLGQAAIALGLDRPTAERILRSPSVAPPRSAVPSAVATSPSAPAPALPPGALAKELELLALLLDHPVLARSAIALHAGELLRAAHPEHGPALAELVAAIAAAADAGSELDIPALLDLAPAPVRERLAKSCVSGKYQRLEEPPRALTEMMATLDRDRTQKELTRVQHELGEADRAHDVPRAQELLDRILELRSRREASGP